MTTVSDAAHGAGFFGKFELSNFLAIKTGVNYNYLGAKRYESEVKYHSASIPILLSECVANGKIKLDGSQTALMSGFGGGLTWGTLVIKL